MFDPELTEGPRDDKGQFEAPREHITAEENCLAALFDMADVDKVGAYQDFNDFFVALHGIPAPDDLLTSIHPHSVRTLSPQIFPEDADAVATVAVGFDTKADVDIKGLLNIDFVKTGDGLKAYKKEFYFEGEDRKPRYIGALDEAQLAALASDASKIAQLVIDTDIERLKLGPLVEEEAPDGSRRFHVGDILSVITRKSLSARGMTGVYDVLGYMTDDVPYDTQLGRFAEECTPSLRKQFDAKLSRFYDPPEEAMLDAPSVYRWLGEVTREIGESFLTVEPVDEDQHSRIDVVSELELDHGSDFLKRIINFNPEETDEV